MQNRLLYKHKMNTPHIPNNNDCKNAFVVVISRPIMSTPPGSCCIPPPTPRPGHLWTRKRSPTTRRTNAPAFPSYISLLMQCRRQIRNYWFSALTRMSMSMLGLGESKRNKTCACSRAYLSTPCPQRPVHPECSAAGCVAASGRSAVYYDRAPGCTFVFSSEWTPFGGADNIVVVFWCCGVLRERISGNWNFNRDDLDRTQRKSLVYIFIWGFLRAKQNGDAPIWLRALIRISTQFYRTVNLSLSLSIALSLLL